MSRTPTERGADLSRKGGPHWFRSLRARLLVSVNVVVALMVFGALVLDYRHQLKTELVAYQSALSDEAKSIIPAVLELQHHGTDVVQRYVDAVCATMQDDSSPGHHIVVDLADETTIQAQSHHRASEAILARIRIAAAAADGQNRSGGVPLVVGTASNNGLYAYVAEESEPVIARIRGQAIVRLLTLAVIGLVGALLVNLLLVRLVTRPIGDLVRVVRRIGAGELGTRPHSFATEDLDILATEIGRMSTDLEARELDRAAHLRKAKRLQDRLLPQFASEDGIAVAAVYRPADTVAGDYYDMLPLPDGSVLICVADVCGHGVPAAMGAAILKTLLLAACEQHTTLVDIFSHINDRFLRVSLSEDFASMVLLRVEPGASVLEYASAGHEPSYLLHESGELEQLDSTGMLLGVSGDAVWTSVSLSVAPTDRLILLTDGVTELSDARGHHFGREALINLLTQLGAHSVEEIARAMTTALDRHGKDATVNDDQTILVLSPCPAPVASIVGCDG